MKKLTLDWLKAAAKRAVKTMAQVALAQIVVGGGVEETDWLRIASVSLVAGVASILTSVAGLPETAQDGVLMIDTSDPEKDTFRFAMNEHPTDLKDRKYMHLKIDPNADLSQDKHIL